MSRVFVIGLDGGEQAVLRAGFDAGLLPNLKRLADEGVWGPLRSTHPPLTPAAWTSFFTGVGPGHHGIYGFVARDADAYTTHPVSASDRRHPTLFARLAAAGHRVASLGVPWTYPPETLPGGCVVGGSGSPGSRRDAVTPPWFFDELERRVGSIPFTPATWNEPAFVSQAENLIRRRFELSSMAMERFDPDLLMMVVQETDGVSHRFWGNRAEGVPPAVLALYATVDAQLGEFLARHAAEDDAILVVSDHGSGPCTLRVNLNKILADLGFLSARAGGRPPPVRRAIRGARSYYRRHTMGSRRRRLRELVPAAMMRRLSSYMHHSDVDWPNTAAAAIYEYGAVHLNVKGREPDGSIDPADYSRVRDEVRSALEDIRTPSGDPLFSKVWRREDLYDGPFAGEAPDLVGDARDPGHGIYGWWDLSRPAFMDPSDTGVEDRNRIGMHRPAGIHILADPLASGARNSSVNIDDVFPAVLAGRGLLPLESELADLWYGEKPGVKEPTPTQPTAPGESLSSEEAAQVEQRLREMGYID